jgi:glycerol-3-phosphate dehydrogenase
LRIAVIGAGINGTMSARALAKAGHRVVLFDRGEAMAQTSSASTKLLHGGLRYLEHGAIGLVREGLRERAWWLREAPHLTRRIEIVLPVYRGAARGRVVLKAGLLAYDLLAGSRRLGWHRWLDARALLERVPGLRPEGLRGGYRFFDGQMDDRALGLWALAQVLDGGVELREHAPVTGIDIDGGVTTGAGRESYDVVVNAAGPWADSLLEASGIASAHHLDPVRGSHLVVDRPLRTGLLLESPDDRRVCFALPWKGRMLIGTTEVRQRLDEPIACSGAEREYLSRLHDACLRPALRDADIVETFAGVRPLLAGSQRDASSVSRESVLERRGRLLTVFGGKWTTARVLGLKVARAVAVMEADASR